MDDLVKSRLESWVFTWAMGTMIPYVLGISSEDAESKKFRMQDQRKSSCLFVCYIFQYSEEPVYNKKE